jgi:GT2 family glycosyltransferase
VILVDNNSTAFDQYRAERIYPGIEIIALQENIGFAAANNLAIRMLEDVEWVALLNPDAYPRPDWLAELLTAAQQETAFQFFGSRMMSTDSGSMDGTGDVYHVSGAVWRRDHGVAPASSCQQRGEIFAPSAAAALYRRDLLLQADGFDEDFFCYMEDVDLGFRLRLAGYRCLYVPEAVVVHEGSGLVGEYSNFQVYHGHRNLVWVYLSNMPGIWLWLYLPQHLLYNLASIALFAWRRKLRVILRAKYDALRGIPAAWRKRRLIQRRARADGSQLRRVMAHGWLTPYLSRNT